MTTQPTTPSVVNALAAVMEAVRSVRKGDRNQSQGYAFRGIDATVNAVGPELRNQGIVVVPILEGASYRDVQTSSGKPSRECTVQVRYRFYGPAGDYIDCVVPGEAMDFGDKGTPKAMSVAFRIALLQALCLPTDDADPDSHSYEREAPSVGRGQAPQPPKDKFGGTDPDEIRGRLRADCEENGWDLYVVGETFVAEHKMTLKDCNDPKIINGFWKTLAGRPQKALEIPAKPEAVGAK